MSMTEIVRLIKVHRSRRRPIRSRTREVGRVALEGHEKCRCPRDVVAKTECTGEKPEER